MLSTLILLALCSALGLWLLVSGLRTGRADALVFAKPDTREAQPVIFWSYTVVMGVFFIGSAWVLVSLLISR
jgi:hypothetical protein